MLTHWKKLVAVFGVAGLMVFLTVAVSEAKPLTQTVLPDDCGECHESVQTHWQESAHGQALADPVFQQAWQEQGNPVECMACHTTGYDAETETWAEDGVTCAACHSLGPNSSHHPEQVMSTDVSSRACGTCHIDTHAEWEVSAHGQSELNCSSCHNPHTTSLKTDSVQELCIACHNEDTYFYEFTAHAQKGLLCTDCHLRVSDSQMGDGHGQRLHTFAVDLNTCNECHDQEMHSPMTTDASGAMMSDTALLSCLQPEDEQVSPVRTAQTGVAYAAEPALNAQPSGGTAGPFTYLAPAAFGLIFGMMLAPWVEGLYRRRNRRS